MSVYTDFPCDSAVIKWAATECDNQRTGPMSVFDLLFAWNYTLSKIISRDCTSPTIDIIEDIGYIVDPVNNSNGFRSVPVFFNDPTRQAADPKLIDAGMQQLVTMWREPTLLDDEWYYRFEQIHPFKDGNGRVGDILWNWRSGSLRRPVIPPKFTDLAERFSLHVK